MKIVNHRIPRTLFIVYYSDRVYKNTDNILKDTPDEIHFNLSKTFLNYNQAVKYMNSLSKEQMGKLKRYHIRGE